MYKKSKPSVNKKKSTTKEQKGSKEEMYFNGEQENEIRIAIKELDAGKGIPHEKVMTQFKGKCL